MPTLDELISKHELTAFSGAVHSLVRPSVNITARRAQQSSFAPADSRFAGMPHLPAGMEWPHHNGVPLTHIATVRLSVAAKFDASGLLPSSGLLYFWYEAAEGKWGYDPAHRGFCKVGFEPDEDRELIATRMPEYPKHIMEDLRRTEAELLSPCGIEFSSGFTLPNAEWTRAFSPEHAKLADRSEYGSLRESLARCPSHQLLGHPTLAQGPWELGCQLVTHGVQRSDEHGPDAARLKAGAKDWRLLLQVDTDERGPGWMWGDCGKLYFTITESALRARDFDKSWLILQC